MPLRTCRQLGATFVGVECLDGKRDKECGDKISEHDAGNHVGVLVILIYFPFTPELLQPRKTLVAED